MSKKNLPDLGSVETRDLTSQVVVRLRDALMTNAIPPGEHLVESDIAHQMGVSRAPVREAIRVLDQEGLVKYFPYRGAIAVGLSAEELDACYELRATIEAHSLVPLVGALDDDVARSLEGLISKMDQVNDVELLTAFDVDFHRLLVEASGYHFLLRRWENLSGMIRLRLLQSLEHLGEWTDVFRSGVAHSHQVILDSIRAGDLEEAQGIMRRHILSVAPVMRSVADQISG